MARRAQVVTRRILHRMYHQCGNTDTYLSPPPPRPPPQLLTLGESRPNRPTHSSTTLPFRRILLPSLSFRLDSRQILRVPTLSRYRDIPSMIYTRLSASCSTQAEERERELVVVRACTYTDNEHVGVRGRRAVAAVFS